MYKDFKEYWELKKEMYAKLGVSKDVAYTIWCDAVNLVGLHVMKEIIS